MTEDLSHLPQVNRSQLAWALPRLERYIQWDFAQRDVDKDNLLNWHQVGASTSSYPNRKPMFSWQASS